MVFNGQIDQQFLIKLKFCMKKWYDFDQKNPEKNKRPPPLLETLEK